MNMFDRYALKLDQNVYKSLKGRIRLELLEKDISDCCREFSGGGLDILDIGGGAGHFAKLCLQRGHSVCLCDTSSDMIKQSQIIRDEMTDGAAKNSFQVIQHNFLKAHPIFEKQYDLVLMHGSAEWMEDTKGALLKAIKLVKPGGYFSLLIFNRDKYDLKRGFNGHLLGDVRPKKKKLIPHGAMSVKDTEHFLESNGCTILLQSGIRIFYNFFRQFEKDNLSPEQWLEQEIQYYRQPPYSLLGEHSHFVCTL